jgi:hypothetical protein
VRRSRRTGISDRVPASTDDLARATQHVGHATAAGTLSTGCALEGTRMGRASAHAHANVIGAAITVDGARLTGAANRSA